MTFFDRSNKSVYRADGKSYSCASCGLVKDCITPKMPAFGEFKKKILNIGEAPGETEDEKGKPFQGKTGKLLQATYKKLGIDLFEDCLNINAVNCRPPDNRAPENFEIECCRKSIVDLILKHQPKVIVLLGNSAIYSLIGHRWKKDLGGISKWRGWTIPDQQFNAWICPTFHPSYVDRAETDDVMTIWKHDLSAAIGKLKEPLLKYVEPTIEIITDLRVLENIKSVSAFDYETTGIKPHAEGHRIVSCAIADNENHAYSFLMPQTKEERKPFLKYLASPCGKIAQNMKFEDTWSNVRLRQPVNNWIWDTMIASHIYDNRPGITGLKFQTYVQFGVVDYASDVSPYLQAVEANNANALNKIYSIFDRQGGKMQLLKYGGMDAVFEFRLYRKQTEDILPF